LEAELDPGKTYYVIIEIGGAWKARGILTPVKRDSELWSEIDNYEKTLERYEPDQDLLKGWEGENKDYILNTLVPGYEGGWKNKEWPKLLPEDGR
jgi:hypothetical protein